MSLLISIIISTCLILLYRLELGIQDINVQTNDPFTQHNLNGLWIPVEHVNKLEDNYSELFNHQEVAVKH